MGLYNILIFNQSTMRVKGMGLYNILIFNQSTMRVKGIPVLCEVPCLVDRFFSYCIV